MKNNRPKQKFNFFHFPQGTVVELDAEETSFSKPPTLVRTVDRVIRNGVNSYVLRFTPLVPNQAEPALGDTLNIFYVYRIVKRGSGALLVDNGFWGLRKPDLTKDPIERKGGLVVGDLGTLVRNELVKYNPTGSTVITGDLFDALEQEAFLKQEVINEKFQRYDGTWLHIEGMVTGRYIVKDKTFRKWLRRNYTRFLQPLSPLLAEERLYEKEQYERHCRDMMAEWGEDDTDPLEPSIFDDVDIEDAHLLMDIASSSQTQERPT